MGSSGKSGDITIGYRYFMSLQMLLARGPLDELVEIKVGDQKAWPLEGQTTVTETGFFPINAPELFGGDDREGGIEGTCILLMGEETQDAWGFIKSIMGGRVPGFRGVATIFYDGMICAMNPYPKQWKMRMRRTTAGWDGAVWRPDIAAIWHTTDDGTNIKSMNPAHIIYECATNRKWGRGLPRSFIDEVSFTQAAETLYTERLGLCMRWNRQDTLQSFVQSVVNHIGGSLYIDRMTGLLSLKLIRGDYDSGSLPVFDFNSGLLDIEEADTAARDNAINEVVVTWRDPIEGKDRQVRVQNLASIQSLGSVNTTSTEYKGIPTFALATIIAQRDLRVNSSALKRYKLKLDRRAWRIAPGDVLAVSAPSRGIQNLILRVGKVEDGPLNEGTITVEAVIDVFGLASAAIVDEEPKQWTPPNRAPTAVVDRKVRETTYRELARYVDPANLALITDDQGFLYSLGAKPTPLSLSYYFMSKPDGEAYGNRGTVGFTPRLVLGTSIDPYTTVVPFTGGVDLGVVEIGLTAQLGDEIVRVDDIETDPDNATIGTITIARGCVDTIPTSHPSGRRLLFADNHSLTDRRQYARGETVRAKLLTRTNNGSLPLASAPEDVLEIVGRQGLPYPPGDVRVGGDPFGEVDMVNGPVELSWKHRDRKAQRDQIVEHGAGNIGPETGTTYRVRVYKSSAPTVAIRTVSGIVGTTWTYTTAMNLADNAGTNMIFELESVRDGLVSFQTYRFALIQFVEIGYGAAYGAAYGS